MKEVISATVKTAAIKLLTLSHDPVTQFLTDGVHSIESDSAYQLSVSECGLRIQETCDGGHCTIVPWPHVYSYTFNPHGQEESEDAA